MRKTKIRNKCAHSFLCFNVVFKALLARALIQRKSGHKQERMKSKHSYNQSDGDIFSTEVPLSR